MPIILMFGLSEKLMEMWALYDGKRNPGSYPGVEIQFVQWYLAFNGFQRRSLHPSFDAIGRRFFFGFKMWLIFKGYSVIKIANIG